MIYFRTVGRLFGILAGRDVKPAAREALQACPGADVRFDVPGARLTSLRVGGPVDAVALPADRAGAPGVSPVSGARSARGRFRETDTVRG